jgi:hypothetical protein
MGVPFIPAIAAAGNAMAGPGGMSALLGQGLLWGVAVPGAGMAMNRMLEGSPEDQMRRQMMIQQEFEGEQTQDTSGLEALMSRREAPSLSQLMGESALFKQVEEASYKLKKARNRRPQYLDELGDIVAGQHARIAALQGERTPSALEIIQMMEEMGG